jgi:hypothetical protein
LDIDAAFVERKTGGNWKEISRNSAQFCYISAALQCLFIKHQNQPQDIIKDAIPFMNALKQLQKNREESNGNCNVAEWRVTNKFCNCLHEEYTKT